MIPKVDYETGTHVHVVYMGSDLRKHERGKNKGDRKEQVSKGYINDRDTAVDNSYSFLAAPL